MTGVEHAGQVKPGPSLRVSIALIVVGVALAIPTFVAGIVPIVHEVVSPMRFETPGPVRLHLGKGQYEVYDHTGSSSFGSSFSSDDTVTITPADVTVTAADGSAVEVYGRSATVESLETGGERYVGAARFTTPAAGDYVVRVARPTPDTVVVARSLTDTIRKVIVSFVLAGVGGLVTVLGIVLLIVGSVRRGRVRRAYAYTSTYAPSVPPGWHPDPGGSGRLRYWDGYRWTEHLQ